MENKKKLIKAIKNRVREFLIENAQNKLKFNDFVGKRFPIEIGSSVETSTWDKSKLISKISDVITHNFFDFDFYNGWCSNPKEYLNIFSETTLVPMIENIDETFNEYFDFKRTVYSTNENVLVFIHDDIRGWIDNWFQNNNRVPKEMKREYNRYKQDYFGETIE